MAKPAKPAKPGKDKFDRWFKNKKKSPGEKNLKPKKGQGKGSAKGTKGHEKKSGKGGKGVFKEKLKVTKEPTSLSVDEMSFLSGVKCNVLLLILSSSVSLLTLYSFTKVAWIR